MTEKVFVFVEKRPTQEMRNHSVADLGDGGDTFFIVAMLKA